jgi:hypothetical protein
VSQSGTTGKLLTADDLGISCDFGCMYFIAVVAQRYVEGDPPSVFEISVQTSGKLNFVPCLDYAPDGIRFFTGGRNRQRDGPVPHTYYAVCARKHSAPSNASGSVLAVTFEQCSGESSLYISDTDPSRGGSPHNALLPNATFWGHRLTGNSTCSRKWLAQSWSQTQCADGPSAALLLRNRSNSDNYYLLAAGAGEYKVIVQDGKAPPVQVVVDDKYRGGLGLKGRPWVISSVRHPVLLHNSVVIQWDGAVTIDQAREPIAANLSYLIYIIDLDAAEAQKNVWDQNIHLDTLCGLQWAANHYHPDAVKVQTHRFQESASEGQPAHRVTWDLGAMPVGHTIYITVVATCDQSCMRWLSHTPCGQGSVCQTQSVVYSPLVIMATASPSDNRPAFGQLFIFTFWVAVTALLFMVVVGVKLMHDRGIIADILRRSSREPASLSTPYADSLGEESGGWFRRWGGYAQLSFTEMVDTSTFGSPQGSGTRPNSSSSSSGDGEGVPQPSRRDILVEQGARLMGTVRDGLSVAAAGLASLSRTVGSALSDTASAAFSRYSTGARREGSDRERERDMDRSTHPLTTSSYRPPSPVPLASKSTPASSSAQDSSAFIAMTAIYPDADTMDSRDPSEYTSFPARGQPATASSSSRGARTAAIRDEEEDSEETL